MERITLTTSIRVPLVDDQWTRKMITNWRRLGRRDCQAPTGGSGSFASNVVFKTMTGGLLGVIPKWRGCFRSIQVAAVSIRGNVTPNFGLGRINRARLLLVLDGKIMPPLRLDPNPWVSRIGSPSIRVLCLVIKLRGNGEGIFPFFSRSNFFSIRSLGNVFCRCAWFLSRCHYWTGILGFNYALQCVGVLVNMDAENLPVGWH